MLKFNGYEKGVNLGGWFSQCCHTIEHYDSFITESDFQQLADWDIDHVRIPIDYNLLEDADGNPTEYGMQYLQNAVALCGKYHLNMILDLHKTAGYSFDVGHGESGFFEAPALQERFYQLWERLAKAFGQYHERIAFELLNEVTDQAYCSLWNRISTTCIQRIRKFAPLTKILIGGYWNNSILAIPDLLMPYDEHIIYNFHCYEPLVFTHQGAGWVVNMPTDFRTEFPLTSAQYQKLSNNLALENADLLYLSSPDAKGAEFFRQMFAKAVRIAEERNVPLYCGEYGVISLVDPDSIVAWHEAIHEVFEEFGIGRAVWNYKQLDFGLIDADRAQTLAAVMALL